MVLIGRLSRLKMAIIKTEKDAEDMKKVETILSHTYMALKLNERNILRIYFSYFFDSHTYMTFNIHEFMYT